ncbi:MAG: hypothetical protein H0T79_03350, partial [Deltaproteobacteria bacterium]|nr:hypothetical protein [Deltaproteobacteria bacterium]
MKGGLLAGVLLAVALVACAGGAKTSMAPASTMHTQPGADPADAHAEIEQLDREISAERQRMGLGELPPAPAPNAPGSR